jgi:hypothetical protein
MIMNNHGWRFRALIACRPASTICFMVSNSTGFSAKSRATLRDKIAVNASMYFSVVRVLQRS